MRLMSGLVGLYMNLMQPDFQRSNCYDRPVIVIVIPSFVYNNTDHVWVTRSGVTYFFLLPKRLSLPAIKLAIFWRWRYTSKPLITNTASNLISGPNRKP